MTYRTRRARAVSVVLIALLSIGLAATRALADDPVTVGLSDLSAVDGRATGVLTLRSKSIAQVDPKSVVAEVDGQERPVSVQQSPKVERRAMLVIDTSGSMGPSGMATVRRAVATFLRIAPADVQVGVTTFATTAGVDLRPTRDRSAVQRVVNGLSARGDTSLYAGMGAAAAALGSTGDRSILLLSDGADTIAANGIAALSQTVASLKSSGVRTDVVQFKTSDPDAAQALRAFAGANGGSVVSASNSAGVNAAFETSARALEQQVKFSIDAGATLAGRHTVKISGTAGGTDFAFQRAITFSDTPTPAVATDAANTAPEPDTASAVLPGRSATMATPWLLWLAIGLLSLAFFGLGWAFLTPSLQSRRELRVQSIESYVAGPKTLSRSEGKSSHMAVTEQLVAMAGRFAEGRKSAKGTMALIERADLPFRAGEWFLIHMAAATTGAVLGLFLLHDAGPLAVLAAVAMGGVIGLSLPALFLRTKANRRAAAFERLLPEILTLVATSLRSGFGLPQALEAVARDAADPAAKEFSRALAETRIGTDIADALDRMAGRMDSTSMHWTVMAIRIQREVGGNLAETLRTTSVTLRERESLRRQVRTLSAEGRLSAYILLGLPIALFLYMMLVNYDYISLLWTTTIGLVMLVFTVVLMTIGIFWMNRVVKIEV